MLDVGEIALLCTYGVYFERLMATILVHGFHCRSVSQGVMIVGGAHFALVTARIRIGC
jgi:hypothetical protein